MLIRPEAKEDESAIGALTRDAFRGAPHSDQTEAEIIAALREAGALTVSLVATEHDTIVAHVAFSPVTVNGTHQGWYGLGPVSVTPARQGNGIGQVLINDGLARLKQLGARGCVVLGDPAYYDRFGFKPNEHLTYPNVPRAYFQALSFEDSIPNGIVAYHAGFATR